MQTRPAVLLLILLLPLAACSRHYHPLMASKKAHLVSEQIRSSETCSVFRNKLASPTMDDDAIDDVYHAAMKAHCVNRDI